MIRQWHSAVAFVLLFASFVFFGCSSGGGNSGDDVVTVTATKSATWSYDADYPIFEVSNDVLTVNVTGSLGDKTVYLAKLNDSENVITSSYQRYFKSGSTSNASASIVDDSRSAASLDDNLSDAFEDEEDGTAEIFDSSDEKFEQDKEFRYFVPPVDTRKLLKTPLRSQQEDKEDDSFFSSAPTSRSVATDSAELAATTATSYTVDTSTKNIYIDTNSDISEFSQSKATLRAKGTYCYVWVIDDYYEESSSSSSKVTSTIAQTFADKFDSLYPVVKNVFGSESDKIILYSNGKGTSANMSNYSDTDTMVNIVIYDIGGGDGSNGSIAGYFYSKDYYKNSNEESSGTVIDYSNVGKYFYVDSYYAANNEETTISVLAHEFQHMILFGKKYINKQLTYSTMYSEMLSMICEDMMQEFLELDDSDSPKSRLARFNAYYWQSGLTEYNEDYSSASYADYYAFGAWLCRQYGGAALANAIISNDYVDEESIAAAVNSLKSASYSFDDLIEQFLIALFPGCETYTFNQDADHYSSGNVSYSYPMSAIDLWADDYALSDSLKKSYQNNNYSYAGYDFTGPLLLRGGVGAKELRPYYGFTLHGLNSMSSSTTSVTLTFSSTGSEDLRMFLIIQ